MTTYSKTTLKTFFETNDVPQGSDYVNFIDSCVNIAETSEQTMIGALNTPEIITSQLSAGNAVITGGLRVNGTISAANIVLRDIAASAATFAGKVSANALNVTGDVSANSVYASAMRVTDGYYASVGIVSAAGTAQATAALLPYAINRGAGVADGQTTGFAIPANRTGLSQVIINGAASANLWPPTGGQINALSSNAAFAMAANTPYAIYHVAASSYSVK